VLSLGLCVGVVLWLGTVAVARATPALANSTQELIFLAGQWQFYWGQLLTPADFTAPSGGAPKGGMIAVPSSWVG
jgi:hypothetical protein